MKTAGIVVAAIFVLAPMSVEAQARGTIAGVEQLQAPGDVDRQMSDILRNLPEATPVPTPDPPRPDPLPPEETSIGPRDPSVEVFPDGPAALGAVVAFGDRFWNGHLDDLRAALWRMSRIRPELEAILAGEGVPARFAAVVLVESGANPAALSPKDARGLWQILPDTARRYGLVVSLQRDDRIDLLKSTRAAARYLRDLYQTFGNWRLALAAYNAGEGAIRQAIQRSGSFNFQVLSDRDLIPAETRMYVPAVLAAVDLLDLQGPSGAEPRRGQVSR